ncbi:MAG TPA: aminotransferase class III-fold pyridoxal phosphate-dependent enzyme [Caulobacteraceae bacterium]|jgi:glutamate-1-semialdehyde 2,1-aminomutase
MPARALRTVREPDAAAPPAPAIAVLAEAKGANIRTIDGRDYTDFDNGSGAVLLGHADPDIEAAVAAERRAAARLGGPLAERLIALLPSAEDVRFFPAAPDALEAACQAARRATGRTRILHCRQAPVEDDANNLAAVVADPLAIAPPCRRELAALRQFADRLGAVLIFDERRSALRVHDGGAQALYGVDADLTVVGEALANGRPLAALAGRLELMALVRGAPVAAAALAAGAAVLDKLGREPVLANLGIRGAEVQASLARCIRAHDAQELVTVGGDPTAPTLAFADPKGRGLWLRELWARGVWSFGDLNISYAHGDREIGRLLAACDGALEAVVAAAVPPPRAVPVLREVARR